MAALDGMVLEALTDRLFTPDRLTRLLEAYLVRFGEEETTRRRKLGQARQQAAEVEGKIKRLLATVADGLMEPDDPQLRDMITVLKAQRGAQLDEINLLEGQTKSINRAITPDRIERVSQVLRRALASDDPTFRKAYLRLFVDTVAVGDTEIRIIGRTASLAKAASVEGLPPAAAMVPSFVQEWRPVCDETGHWELVARR